jgi:phthiocerol/phenolphthiocerol synthesis type-I polyketide synthase A
MDDIMAGLRVSGHAFEWSVESHETTPGRVRADVALPAAPAVPVTAVLLDAVLDTAQLVVAAEAGLILPVAAESISVTGAGLLIAPARGVVDVRRYGGSEDDLVVDAAAQTPDGSARVEVRGLRYRVVESSAALAPAADPATVAHAITWEPWKRDDAGTAAPAPIAVVGEGNSAQALRDRFGKLEYSAAPLSEARYVLYAPKVDTAETDVDVAVRLICEVGEIVARLAERDPRKPVTLWILTEGVHEAASASARRQSCLWALAGVIDAEQPQLWGGLLDIGAGDDIADTATTFASILHTPSKSAVLARAGQLLTSVLGPFTGDPIRKPLRCRSDAAYLITGGLGDLGLLMADWLGNRGARRVILLGRTKVPAPGEGGTDPATRRRLSAIRGLERRGVTVETAAIDVGSAEAVQQFLAARQADGAPPIRGVIHAAGLAEGQLLTDLQADRVHRTLWPKIAGAQVLDRAFPPGALDFLYLTASAGTVFGVPGQAAYAGGNAYLDGLARARHGQGDNTVSLDWVAWEGLGFGKDAAIVVDELERVGSRPINPVEASAAWEYVSRYDTAQVVMAPMQGLAPSAAAGPSATPAVAWAELPPEEMRAGLQQGVRTILAGELRLPEDQIELDKPFAEMGLNSVMAISIRRQLEQLVGIELSATMLFNHPTIASFTGYLVARLSPSEADDSFEESDDSAGGLLDALFDDVESTSEGIF